MLGILPLAAVVVALVLLVIAVPGKKRSGSDPQSPAPAAYYAPPTDTHVDRRSLRQRQIDEDAALLSAEFARYEDQRYRAEVRDRAALAFAPAGATHAPAA